MRENNLMKKVLLLLFAVLPIVLLGQTDENKEVSNLASEISGKWILVKYERDSLIRTWECENEKYFVNTYTTKGLIDSKEIEGYNIRVMSFDKYGFGEYEDYSDYKLETDSDYSIEEVDEIPRLFIENGESYIETTYLYGEDDLTFILKLDEDELILKNEKEIKCTYKRLQ